MSGNRTVKVVIAGDSSGVQSAASHASTALGGTATAGERMSNRLGGVFSKMGSTLGGEVGDILTRVGEGFTNVEEKGKTLGKTLTVGGGALAGVGAVLTGIGSGEKEATNQLSAAITASGGSIGDYSKQIEEAVKHNEKFAFGAKDTTAALTVLTEATNSPTKAIDEMGVVANLAAAKHESLAAAGAQVAKILGGSGAKILKQYGITMDSTKAQTTAYTTAVKNHEKALLTLQTAQQKLSNLEQIDAGVKHLSTAQTIALKAAHDAVAKAQTAVTTTTTALAGEQGKVKTTTQNADAALTQLSKKLDGQASASVDSWGGKLRVLKTQIEDQAAAIGQKYGPAITGAGTILMAAGSVSELFARRSAKAMQAASAATEASSTATIASNEATAASETALASATEKAGTKIALSTEETAAKVSAADAEMATANEAAGASKGIGAGAGAAGSGSGGGLGALSGSALAGTATLLAATGAVLALGVAVNKLDGDAGRWKNIQAINNSFGKIPENAKNFAQAITADGDALGATTLQMAATQLQAAGLADSAAKSGISFTYLTQSVTGSNAEFNQMLNTWRQSGNLSKTQEMQILAIRGAYEQGKISADKAKAAIDQVNHAVSALTSPPAVKVTLNDAATAGLRAVEQRLGQLNGMTATVFTDTVVQSIAAGNAGRARGPDRLNAVGTPFFPGGSTWIAEKGPELVDLPAGSKIHTAHQTEQIMRGANSSGGEQPIVVNLVLDGSVIHTSLLKLKRNKGGSLLGLS